MQTGMKYRVIVEFEWPENVTYDTASKEIENRVVKEVTRYSASLKVSSTLYRRRPPTPPDWELVSSDIV